MVYSNPFTPLPKCLYCVGYRRKTLLTSLAPWRL